MRLLKPGSNTSSLKVEIATPVTGEITSGPEENLSSPGEEQSREAVNEEK